MSGRQCAILVTSGYKQQWPIGWRDIVQIDSNVHGTGFRHFVITVPGPEILVPLPNFPVKCGFRIDFILVHVDVFVE